MTSKRKLVTQEFRVMCSRVAGGLPRNPDAKDQDLDRMEVYSKGRGVTLKTRMRNAERRAREIMAPMGWGRFYAKLTIADEELELEAYREQYLQEEDDYINPDIPTEISEEEWELLEVEEVA